MRILLLAVLSLVAASGAAKAEGLLADSEIAKTPLNVERVKPNVHVLSGYGGNIAVLTGVDGAVLVDNSFAALAPRVRKAVAELSTQPIRFVFNTHWHFDHAGANEPFIRNGALLIAHDNIRKRLASGGLLSLMDSPIPPSPPDALPAITFNDRSSYYINSEIVRAIHVPQAHTDGDTFVQFERANVIHLGDVCPGMGYPFIDLNSGGSARGLLDAVDTAIALGNDDTRYVPGHGPMIDRAALTAYRDMLRGIVGNVSTGMKAGRSVDEIITSRPTAAYDDPWAKDGFAAEDLVRSIYESLTRSAGGAKHQPAR